MEMTDPEEWCERQLLKMEEEDRWIWILYFPSFQISLLFYVWIRIYVNRQFPLAEFTNTHAYRCRRWGVSLVHALAATTLSVMVLVPVTPTTLHPCDVLLHSCGYFLADTLGDFSWLYLPHHMAPLLVTEFFLRHHRLSGPCHSHAGFMTLVHFTGWMEAGNTVAHGSALWPTLVGMDVSHESMARPTLWKIRLTAFTLSRLVAFPIAWQMWEKSEFPRIPELAGWDYTLFILAFSTLLVSNVYWILLLIVQGTSATFKI